MHIIDDQDQFLRAAMDEDLPMVHPPHTQDNTYPQALLSFRRGSKEGHMVPGCMDQYTCSTLQRNTPLCQEDRAHSTVYSLWLYNKEGRIYS